MDVRLLGPIDVLLDGHLLPEGDVLLSGRAGWSPRGAKQAAVLALLAMHPGETLSAERMLDEVWGEGVPERGNGALQVQISKLRSALGARSIETVGRGYRLSVGPQQVDAHVFEALLARGRTAAHAGMHADASDAFTEALALWRGDALGGIGGIADAPFVRAARVRLEEGRLGAYEDHVDAHLHLGYHVDLLPELEEACSQHPLRERRWGQLMVAFYRAGRQAEALRAYQTAREHLREELGVEPGPELKAVERQILQQDASLTGTTPVRSVPSVDSAPPARPTAPTPPMRPSGVITFLFSDVESSTRRWEHAPAAMADALSRHDTLLDEVFRRHGGYVFSKGGDGRAVAFSSPWDAMAAAAEVQRSAMSMDWGATGPLAIRMSVHTGPAEERDGDYFGPTLNRAARLLEAAVGGQVLLSRATEELLHERMPVGLELFDRGDVQLRDLTRTERVFELTGHDLPTPGRALRVTTPRRSNLPSHQTTFVGRSRELAALTELLKTNRLVTLVGPGGAGKTRLALAGATASVDEYPDGVWLIELAGLGDSEHVVPLVASVLGLRDVEPGGVRTNTQGRDRIAEYLAPKRVLLILDNCEHVIGEAASIASFLLMRCPDLVVTATSREGLGVGGEMLWPVPPLHPDEAVLLFVDRATKAAPSFELSDEALPYLEEICARLDGLPLAIELAAARVRTFPLPEIVERLDDRFRLLTGGVRTAMPRQQTLRAVVDWSYDLLDERERTVFNRLSVFAESCTLEAAQAVVADPGTDATRAVRAPNHDDAIDVIDVIDVIGHLVDKSLVQPVHQGLKARYFLLQTLAQYGRERLAASGEADIVRDRHAQFFADFAKRGRAAFGESGQGQWMEALSDDLANIRVALDWLRDHHSPDAYVATLSWLGWFFWLSGRPDEGYERLNDALENHAVVDPFVLAEARVFRGFLLGFHGFAESGADEAIGGAALAEELGDLDTATIGYLAGGQLSIFRGDLTGAERHLTEVRRLLDLRDATGWGEHAGGWEEDVLKLVSAGLAFAAGRFDDSAKLLTSCVAKFRRGGFAWGLGFALTQLGQLHELRGEYDAAAAVFDEAVELTADNGFRSYHVMTLTMRGNLAVLQNEHDLAAELHQRALDHARDLVLPWMEDVARVSLANAARNRGRLDEAGRLMEEALAVAPPTMAENHLLAECVAGFIAEEQGDPIRAKRLHHGAAVRMYRQGDPRCLALALEGLAGAHSLLPERGDVLLSAQLLARATRMRADIGAPLPAAQRRDVDRIERRLRERLGSELDEHLAAGALMDVGQLLEESAA